MKNNFRVVLALKKKKVSDVSRDTGISLQTILVIYNERTKEPMVTTLMTIANYLGVSIDDLMNQGVITMENTLKELLAEVKSINEKLERIEKHTKPIDLKVDVAAKLDEIKAKKDNQI